MDALSRAPMNHPLEWLKDGFAGIAGGATFGAWMLDYIHSLEGVIAGALAIVLLVLRIRRHLRDDMLPPPDPNPGDGTGE